MSVLRQSSSSPLQPEISGPFCLGRKAGDALTSLLHRKRLIVIKIDDRGSVGPRANEPDLIKIDCDVTVVGGLRENNKCRHASALPKNKESDCRVTHTGRGTRTGRQAVASWGDRTALGESAHWYKKAIAISGISAHGSSRIGCRIERQPKEPDAEFPMRRPQVFCVGNPWRLARRG